MTATVTPAGHFTTWPQIGDVYRTPHGELVSIAAIWSGGVVFDGGRQSATAAELQAHYQPITGKDTTHA